MFGLSTLSDAVGTELIRAITGSLFTEEQIRSLTSHTVGKYFADWLPELGKEKAARERVEDARAHIAKASAIITGMQTELTAQTGQLDKLLVEIEEKKKLVSCFRSPYTIRCHRLLTRAAQYRVPSRDRQGAVCVGITEAGH